MPARVSLFTRTAVVRAPHSLPFAKVTCCMRESSLATGRSGFRNGPPLLMPSRRQQPKPVGVANAVSARQSRNGKLFDAFCSDRGGTAYVRVGTARTESASAEGMESMACVFDTAQTCTWLELRVVDKIASELRKNSVPPSPVS